MSCILAALTAEPIPMHWLRVRRELTFKQNGGTCGKRPLCTFCRQTQFKEVFRDRTAHHFFQSLKSLSYRRRCLNPNRIEQNIDSKTVRVSSLENPTKNQLTFLLHNWLLTSVTRLVFFQDAGNLFAFFLDFQVRYLSCSKLSEQNIIKIANTGNRTINQNRFPFTPEFPFKMKAEQGLSYFLKKFKHATICS